MRRLLLSLTVLAGAAGAACAANPVAAAPMHPEAITALHVQTVQYYGDGRYREWRRHEAQKRWRRHESWRRWHHYRGW